MLPAIDCRHWKAVWQDVILPQATQERLLLACDFDGTLSPIAATPWEAQLPEDTRILLQKLSHCPGVTLAFVSGRDLSDLKTRVGLENAIYCGNHGLQIEGPNVRWECEEARARRYSLDSAVRALKNELVGILGVIVEDKGLTASVHWRLVSEGDRKVIHPLVTKITRSYPDLRLTHGKYVWELRPRVGRNKGTALQSLLKHADLNPAQAIFLGDDEADEGAFRVIPDGISIKVGRLCETSARFRAEDPKDVSGMLFCLFMARVGKLDERDWPAPSIL